MVEMNKAKVLIVLLVSSVIVALALIGLEAALIYTASNIQQSVETVSNVQTSFNKLGMQLSTTTGDEDKTAATALIVTGSITIVVNLMLLISCCVYWIHRKKGVTKIQFIVKTSVIIIGCMHIILVIPGSVYLDTMQTLQASKINQTELLKILQDGYKDDSFPSPGNVVSDAWNEIFIEFKCCAVYAVKSTTNDFDLTPWCTTSGSCQQTNSQIPKTCCKGVDKTSYASAPRACHEYANSGYYHEQGCVDVWPNVIGILTDMKKLVYSIGMTALVLQAILSVLCLSLVMTL